jgi:hypothetical protein
MGSQRALVEPLHRYDPARIGSYQLIGRLGAGAMGRVYLGRSAAGRLVAVKTIKPEYAEEADFRARFAREVAAARRVSGVFTAAVIAADPEADVPWLATAYVPAPSLDQLVRRCGPLPVGAVRWLAAGCAEALESIHEAGLVHRDLKPSNVLVALDGPRVIDFGVARAAERIQLTSTRGALGTPAYIAPEQARDTRHATAASDMFSLGCTLLFAATGHAPYQGETVMDILVRLATEPPDLTGLPAELTDLVSGCLDREPDRRPTSADLLAEIAEQVTGSPGGAADSEFGSGALPRQAAELIEEYRRPVEPEPPASRPAAAGTAEPAGPPDTDATVGSQLAGRWPLRFPRSGRHPAAGRHPAGGGHPAAGRTGGSGHPAAGRTGGSGPAGGGTGGSGPAGGGPGGSGPAGGGAAGGGAAGGSGPAGGRSGGGGPAGGAAGGRPDRQTRPDGPADRQPPGPAAAGAGANRGHVRLLRSAAAAPGPGGWRFSGVLSVVVSIGAVVALVSLGTVLGGWLNRPGGNRGSGAAAAASSTAGQPTGQPAGPPGGGRPPDPPGPASGQYDHPGGSAQIEVNQPMGDGYTVFVVHGRGWPVGQPVTVALNGTSSRLLPPKADMAGTFNYAINQAHEFYRDVLPPGIYRVTAAGAGGRHAQVSFEVHP